VVSETVACVGAIVHDDQGRLLLVRRGNEPAKGSWSIPGGRVEPGERDRAATARETREETGVDVEVGALVGSVRRDAPGGAVFVIRDYACRLVRPADVTGLRAGDDADDVGWFGAEELATLTCSPGLLEALAGWGMLPG
jgi:8-oxo-dGTP diphosphatase